MVYGDVWLYAALLLYWLYCCIATQWARDHATLLYCLIQHVFVLYCCRARCIGFTPAQASRHGCAAVRLDDMPEELRGCCAHALDTSAGCFGQVNKSCKELVEGRLAEEKEAHEAPYRKFSSRYCEALCSMMRIPDGPKLITFPDGGATIFKCPCMEKELKVRGAISPTSQDTWVLAASRHWYYRRLVHVNGERPSAHLKAEWLAVKATLPAAVAPM
jgi:hypothetical protein